MSEFASETPLPRHDPLAALRQRNFLLFTSNQLLNGMGQALMQAAMAWQVAHLSNSLSGSALNLGLLGLARFFPSLGMSLVGGMVADSYNRRNVVVMAQTVPLACAAVLAVATLGGWVRAEMIFGVAVLLGLAGAFGQPARSALLPAIVRPETFANAVTVSSVIGSVGQVSGPLLAGAIISVSGTGEAYAAFAALSGSSLLPFLLIRYIQAGGERRRVSVAALKEGVNYVRHRQALLGAMTLDMFAIVFGGAEALLPIFASDILHVGALGFGVLSASMRIGGLVMAFGLVLRPPVVRAGRAFVYATVLYGLATILFGLSRNFALSLALYMAIGAVDQVSMVMRQTMIQLSTPDELRGRVSAVNQVFVGTSNQVGAMESGFVAAVTSATFAVVSGGIAAVVVAGVLGWRMKELFAYRVPRFAEGHAAPSAGPSSDGASSGARDAPVEEAAPAAGS